VAAGPARQKQYEVAEAAGITKGMLSAYETGVSGLLSRPSTRSWGTLACDLNRLCTTPFRSCNGKPEGMPAEGRGDRAVRSRQRGLLSAPVQTSERAWTFQRILGPAPRLLPPRGGTAA